MEAVGLAFRPFPLIPTITTDTLLRTRGRVEVAMILPITDDEGQVRRARVWAWCDFSFKRVTPQDQNVNYRLIGLHLDVVRSSFSLSDPRV
jgi:hypothetical protein